MSNIAIVRIFAIDAKDIDNTLTDNLNPILIQLDAVVIRIECLGSGTPVKIATSISFLTTGDVTVNRIVSSSMIDTSATIIWIDVVTVNHSVQGALSIKCDALNIIGTWLAVQAGVITNSIRIEVRYKVGVNLPCFNEGTILDYSFALASKVVLLATPVKGSADVYLFATNLVVRNRTWLRRLLRTVRSGADRETDATVAYRSTDVSRRTLGAITTIDATSTIDTDGSRRARIVLTTLARHTSTWRIDAVLINKAVVVSGTRLAADAKDTLVSRWATFRSTRTFGSSYRQTVSVEADEVGRAG